jgi:hypothetical protein
MAITDHNSWAAFEIAMHVLFILQAQAANIASGTTNVKHARSSNSPTIVLSPEDGHVAETCRVILRNFKV